MHAVAHSFAHRAPPASRTKARWQPYVAMQPSSVPPRSPTAYLITPASSVSSTPASTRLCESSGFISSSSQSPPAAMQIRDVQKTKYAISLVDQAVKCLCEIWQPKDVPAVFLTFTRPVSVLPREAPVMPPAHPPARQAHSQISPYNTQLPSPVSPTSQPSPFSLQPTPPQSSRLTTAEMCDPRNSFVPLRGFVHEVLRKSRTSGAVLQTALCYLEAIRTKVPDLVREEQCGEGVRGEKEPAGRIIKAEEYNEADESMDEFSAAIGNGLLVSSSREESAMDTGSLDVVVSQGLSSHRRKEPQAPLPPLPPLPSPLLCPKRAFLASLILASKFTQDRCYSNRAWAKLCSLPPREMGRCERALGEALQWRLWVGKKSSASASPASTNGRSVVRCHSVDDLRREGALSISPARDHMGAEPKEPRWMGAAATTHRGLGRSSSLPARAFCSAEISSTGSNSTSTNFDWAPTFWPTPNPAGLDPQMPPRSSWSSSISNTHGDSQQTTPPTPTLSYSPASAGSTDSSGGDRTVQMDGIPTPPHFMSGAFGPSKTDLLEDFATGLPVAMPFIVGQNVLPVGHIRSGASQKLGVMMVPNEGTFSGLDAFSSY